MSAATTSPNGPTLTADAVDAAQLISGPPSWLERVADRMNPILVKETRQSLKSRQFVIAFLLLLAAGWLVSVFATLLNPSQLEYGEAGRELFATYYVILSAAIFVVVPFGAYRSLLTERDEATYEALVITSLRPQQIVTGKLLSALLQTFLFYSAIAPFMAFTALLQGFDFAHVAFMLTLGLAISLWVSMASLAVSAMVKGKVWQTLVSLAVIGGLVWAFGLMCSLAFENRWYAFDEPEFWMLIGMLAVAGVSYYLLLQQVAVTNLTFEADNRSTGLRIISTVQLLLLAGCVAGVIEYERRRRGGTASSDLIWAPMGFALGHLAVMGLFFSTERPGMSQRVRRSLPKNGLFRMLFAPFYPGGERGLLYLWLHVGAAWLVMYLATTEWIKAPFSDGHRVMTALALYVLIYISLGAAISRWGMALTPAIQPIHARVITILAAALLMILPMFALLVRDYSYGDYSLIFLPNIFFTIERLWRLDVYSRSIFAGLGVWAAAMLAINLPAMLRGLTEINVTPAGSRAADEEHASREGTAG